MDIDGKLYCSRCMRQMETEGTCPHCGYTPGKETDTFTLEEGTLLNGRYQLGARIGQGGFGITYAAWDEILDTPVVIKEYYPVDFATRNTIHSDDVQPLPDKQAIYVDGMKRFQRESHLLAELQGIPEVVKVLDFFTENNTAYIAMEYIHGTEVDAWVEQHHLSGRHVIMLMRPVIDALVNAHKQGVLHRDLTPSNILVRDDGSLKLIDFGSATEVKKSRGTIMLTRQYAPVEQYGSEHGSQGPWTDVYGICAVLYTLLTGQAPQEAVLRIYDDQLKPPKTPIKKSQSAALMAGLAVNPEKRIQSMEELRSRLYDLPLPEHIVQRKRVARRIAIAVAVLFCLTALILSNFSIGLPLGKGLLYGLRSDGWHVMGHYHAATDIELPEKLVGIPVTAVDDQALRDAQVERLVVPGSVQHIGDMALYGNDSLKELVLEDGVTAIGVGSFAQCTQLQEVHLPDTLTVLPTDAFSGNRKDLIIWGHRGAASEAFSSSQSLHFVDGTELVFDEGEQGLILVSVESEAEQLTIPSYVNGRPVMAIAEGVRIRNAVNLTLPSELATIPACLCKGNTALTVVVMGDNINVIGDEAFSGCEQLSELNWPSALAEIGNEAFYKCRAIETAILPEHVEWVGEMCFAGCASLTKVYHPDSVTYVGKKCYMNDTALHEVRLSSGMKELHDQVLYNTGITHLHLPDSLQTLGKYCFTYSPLEYLMIPASVETMGTGSFYGCERLQLLLLMNKDLSITDDYSNSHQEALNMLLWRCPDDLVIAGPAGSTAETLAEGFIFEDVTMWSEEMTLQGDTAFFPEGMTGMACVPWYNIGEDCPVLRTQGAQKASLTAIRLPLLKTSIQPEEYADCMALETVQVTGRLTDIGNSAFEDCSALENFPMTEGLQSIGEAAFKGCALQEVILPDTVTTVDEHAFEDCKRLTMLRISNRMTLLSPYVFSNTGVSEITIPGNIWQVNMYAFGNCSNLETLTVSEGVKRLDSQAIANCEHLKTVTLPSTMYMIGGMTFTGADLQDVWVYNPDMSFMAYVGRPSIEGSTPTVHSYVGSVAERFAEMLDLPFEAVE